VPGIEAAQQNQKDFIIRNSLFDIRYSFFQVKQGGFLGWRLNRMRTSAAMNW
jgi:hypothetical protein